MGKSAYSRAFIVLGIFCLATTNVNAGEMYFTPAVVYTDDDKDRGADDGVGGGQLSFGWVLTDRISLEAMAGYSDLGGIDNLVPCLGISFAGFLGRFQKITILWL